jgi:hypothetical protein
VRTGEKSAGQWTVWQDADALVGAERDHLPLVLAVDEVVAGLHGHEPGPAGCLRGVLRLRELPGVHQGRADVSDLPGVYQVVQGLHGFFDRCFGVPPVDLVQVDVVGGQPPQ